MMIWLLNNNLFTQLAKAEMATFGVSFQPPDEFLFSKISFQMYLKSLAPEPLSKNIQSKTVT